MNLYKFQTEVLEASQSLKKVAYFFDMGLGKTFIGAEKLMRLNAPKSLIVCQKSKISDWIDHFKIHYGVEVINLRSEKGLKTFLQKDGIGVINYDLVWRRDLSSLKNFTLLLDESSEIQRTQSKRTRAILNLTPENVILLSGTPTSGKYENLWSQGRLLGWSIPKWVYDSQFINWVPMNLHGMAFRIVDRNNPYKNVHLLKRKLREHGAFFKKTEEVFDLPSQNFIPILVPSTKQYRDFKKNRRVVINSKEFVGDTSLAYRLALRQLCGVFNKHKLEALRDLLSSTRDRVLVYYNFDSELESIQLICSRLERPVSVINGHRKDLCSYENCDDSITIIQYQAGAMGLNLQKSNKIIYFSLPERSDLFEQSKKRIHRIGQERPCYYYLLLVKDSVETNEVLENLNLRKEITDKLFEKR